MGKKNNEMDTGPEYDEIPLKAIYSDADHELIPGEDVENARKTAFKRALLMLAIAVTGALIYVGAKEICTDAQELFSAFTNTTEDNSPEALKKQAYNEMVSYLKANWTTAAISVEDQDMKHIEEFVIKTRENNLGLNEDSPLYDSTGVTWQDLQYVFDTYELEGISRKPQNVMISKLRGKLAKTESKEEKANILAEYIKDYCRSSNSTCFSWEGVQLVEDDQIDNKPVTKEELEEFIKDFDGSIPKEISNAILVLSQEFEEER